MITQHPIGTPQPQHDYSDKHKTSITSSLKRLGANQYDLWLPETHSLPAFIRADETLEGIIYGKYHISSELPSGRGALVATNRRVIFIDRKPGYTRATEIAYDVVSAITRSQTGFTNYVTLNTRLADITIRTFNPRCAMSFVEAIEHNIFNHRRPQ